MVAAQFPRYKLRGEDAEMSCSYDLESDTLYSVKWYKDDEEFYRYMPGSVPVKQLFTRPGVRVHLSKSNASHVVLTDIDFSSSGLYRCEISVENSFNTLNRYGRFFVVELPSKGPRITGVKPKYKYGEFLKANCTSAGSYPAAQLSWHINDQKVKSNYTQSYPTMRLPDGLETSRLELFIETDKHHFRNGRMKLRCNSIVSPVYSNSEQNFMESKKLINKPTVLIMQDELIHVSGNWNYHEEFRLQNCALKTSLFLAFLKILI